MPNSSSSTPALDKEGVVEITQADRLRRIRLAFDDLSRKIHKAGHPLPDYYNEFVELGEAIPLLEEIDAITPLSPPPVVEEAGPCPHCDDSGYVETSRGGHWTGENLSSSMSICDCPCGDDVRRERAAPTPPAGEEEVEAAASIMDAVTAEEAGELKARGILWPFIPGEREQGEAAWSEWRNALQPEHVPDPREQPFHAFLAGWQMRAALPSTRGITIPDSDELRKALEHIRDNVQDLWAAKHTARQALASKPLPPTDDVQARALEDEVALRCWTENECDSQHPGDFYRAVRRALSAQSPPPIMGEGLVEAGARGIARMVVASPSLSAESQTEWVDNNWYRYADDARTCLVAALATPSLPEGMGRDVQSAGRACEVCKATVAESVDAMCCHCTEMPWKLATAPASPKEPSE